MFNLTDEINFYYGKIEMYRNRLESVKAAGQRSEVKYYSKLIKELESRYERLCYLAEHRFDVECAVYDFLAETWDYAIDMALELRGGTFFCTNFIYKSDAVVLIHNGTDDENEPIIKWEYAVKFVDKYIEKIAMGK